MDWKQLGSQVIGMGLPLLGGALGGPAGAAVGQLIASKLGGAASGQDGSVTAQSVLDAIKKDQEAVLKLRELELTHEADLFRMASEESMRTIEAVNSSMQSEAKSEHWAQWTWRPFIGFCFGTQIFATYFVLPLMDVPVPAVPESVWLAYLAVLGAASYFRGKAKLDEAGAK